MNDCIFCKIVAGAIPAQRVYEDDLMIAFKDINPKAPVHLLAVPRLHLARLDGLDDSHRELIAHMMLTLPRLAREQGAGDFRTIINNGAGAGQEVPHLHMHILGGGKLPGF